MISAPRAQRMVSYFRARPLMIVWLGCTTLVLLPIWIPRVLPMLDVPNHLAQIRAWHDHDHPAWHVGEYFDVRIHVVPYMLYHCLVHLLMFVVPIEIANKLCVSLYVVLFPLALRALARALQRSEWLALSGFALAFNQSFIYGFVSYLLGSCFLFIGIAAVIRFADHARRRDLIWIGVSGIVTFLSHVLPYALFGIMTVALLACEPRNWRRALAVLAVLVPALIIGVLSFTSEHAHGPFLYDSLQVVGTWRSVGALIREAPHRILDLFPGELETVVLLILTATTIALIGWKGIRGEDDAAKRGTRRLVILLAVAVVFYRALPFSVDRPMRWWFIAPRMPSIIAALLVLLPAGPFSGRARLALVPVVGATVLLVAKLTTLYVDFSHRNADFFALLAKTPRGANTFIAVAGVWRSPNPGESSGDPASSGPVYWHWAEWATALKGGYSPYLFDVGFPVAPKPERALRAPGFGDWDGFHPGKAPAFDYYLIQHPVALSHPCCELVGKRGDWALMHRIR
jgi:hypothetical protein